MLTASTLGPPKAATFAPSFGHLRRPGPAYIETGVGWLRKAHPSLAITMYPLGSLLTRIGDNDAGPARLVGTNGSSRGRIQFLWTRTECEMNLQEAPFGRLELFSGNPV